MQRIRNGKLYDTNTAAFIAMTDSECCDTYHAEEFYRKQNGEFFLRLVDAHRNYGEMRYSIKPLNYEEAIEWAELYMSRAEYESVFGPVSE